MKFLYRNICRFALASLLVLPMSVATTSAAKANVTITPTIVVIEGRNRFADVNLINVSDKINTYEIGWKFMKMVDESGDYENLTASLTDFDLTKNIVFTPRKVTIQPKELQKIRLGLRLKGEPPAPGDYRAHLELKSTGSLARAEQSEPSAQKSVKMGVKINVGFSIPVIYRVGESDAMPVFGEITSSMDKSGRPEIIVPVTKTGNPNFGVLGHIIVYRDSKIIGEIKNANIFPEINKRTYKIPLNVQSLSGGSIRVVYKHYDPKNDTVYAEKTVSIGK